MIIEKDGYFYVEMDGGLSAVNVSRFLFQHGIILENTTSKLWDDGHIVVTDELMPDKGHEDRYHKVLVRLPNVELAFAFTNMYGLDKLP